MKSFSDTEEDEFFDTRDNLSSVSDLSSDCPEFCPGSVIANSAIGYDFWTKKPNSVRERRDNFLKLMGLSLDNHNRDGDEDDDLRYEDNSKRDDDGDAELANSESEPIEDGATYDNRTFKITNLDNGTEFAVDEQAEDGSITTLRELGSGNSISLDELQKTSGYSEVVRQLLRKESKRFNDKFDSKTKSKRKWLQRFSMVAHIADRTKGFIDKTNHTNSKTRSSVHVHVSKKCSKELSALHTGQEFPAHEGSIMTMKFSHDGRYLASGGVDGVVRVWKVLEHETINKFNAQDLDPCRLLWLDDISKLGHLNVLNENNTSSVKSSSKLSDPASVVLPPKYFQLSEKPLHEFHGHESEVLGLSWSTNGSLLSSSVDKTVRLWRVGDDHCLRVYSHNNYVTCVEFNPVDNNHFISGSIDGKLRIWEVEGGRVIDWVDTKEIITAVCYCPDGKGGVVGSMIGNCHFYDVIDNRLELGAQVCLKGKKKLPGKKITGFEYCPGDARKVMVTSADSQIRIISSTDIVCKFKGHRSSGTQVPASFTSDGEHIISISEDSNVRVWNYTTQDKTLSRQKNIWSCESFLLRNASIAIPWGGLKNKIGGLPGSILERRHFDEKLLQKLPTSFPDCLTTSLGFFLDPLYKGSTTWPEERLPKSNPTTTVKSKSGFKFLKSALNNPHLWGLVIVTAGWDGCIRTFLNYGLPIRF